LILFPVGAIAITLDGNCPLPGWKVPDLLRNDLNFRHIPIHLISGEENRELAIRRGARSFLRAIGKRIAETTVRDILVFQRRKPGKIRREDNETDSSNRGKMLMSERLGVLADTMVLRIIWIFDCIIMDYSVPDIQPGPER
jgi:hypothetical protein